MLLDDRWNERGQYWKRVLVFGFLGWMLGAVGQQTSGEELSGAGEEHRARPNIIVLLADDLGYGELGCQGNPQIPTPRIDQLAETGVRFTQAYVTAPNCSPSRAGLLTGRTPTRFGYEFNPIGARNHDPGTGLPAEQLTIAEHLQQIGYTSGLIGKWHLGGSADFHPFRHGFDEFFGFLHEGHFYVPPPWHGTLSMLRRAGLADPTSTLQRVSDQLFYSTHTGRNEPAYDANNPILRGGQPTTESQYLTEAFAREASDFIGRHRESPFFLYVAFNAVHSPLQAREAALEEFEDIEDPQRRIFAGMLRDLDRAVGTIVDAVDQQGLRDNTLILFLSDNGGPTRELTSSNAPLRGEKGSMYEGGLRVPFIVNWPVRLSEPSVEGRVVSSLDIFPTIAAATNTPLPQGLEGQDLLELLQNPDEPSGHQHLYWRQGNRTALRHGEWKIVDSRYASNGRREWELFNIAADANEVHDRSDAEPAKVQQLVKLWSELDQEMSAPLFPVR
ncbi:sulfatase-like hydrolase/transferase [Aureliella helgolandensis]|uniref:Arylsulfatase n=1 Tax=Aureliella helgolandensis TaxID=2527968 RepID=A0A518GAW5_9BACT|nr:sulfatase-like hydrolase/transferase [Aureliella helgolandensis]QDV25697.1 Arylsulfatase [Aureliella helgolandensis]